MDYEETMKNAYDFNQYNNCIFFKEKSPQYFSY